jgi:fructose-1,6-bisphosphatase/inositol monophosphatase family enzyme
MMFGDRSPQDIDAIVTTMLDAGMRAAEGAVKGGSVIEVIAKDAYDGTVDGDITTTADLAAQAACEKVRQEQTPWAGVIAEELGLREPSTLPGHDAYWTYDGVDGTKRLEKLLREGQALNGIATMVAFVYDGRVVAAAIGDIFDPSGPVYRLRASGNIVELQRTGLQPVNLGTMLRPTPITQGRVLVRGRLENYHPLVSSLLNKLSGEREPHSNLSIGLSMARLWADDIVLHVQSPGNHTPWDNTPYDGIAQEVGIMYLRPTEDGTALEQFIPPRYLYVTPRPTCVLAVHRARLSQLRALVQVRTL